jgi:dienelactone hydrolase
VFLPHRSTSALVVTVTAALVAALCTAAPATAATVINCAAAPYPSADWTACETANLAVSQGNQALVTTLLPQTTAATASYKAQLAARPLTDPERQPDLSPCPLTCTVDARTQNWNGKVKSVLFTSRSGATISGHVFAASSGSAKRPGVLIINGSIVGYEQGYWWAAEALAEAGFVVMAFDPQGEGMSDQFGQAPDQLEDAFAGTAGLGVLKPPGVASPGLGGNGLTFYDGGVDALNFFTSTPSHPYVPVPSRSTGTSHAAKQTRRVLEGLDSAYNPFWNLLDPSEIGLAGHSYGADATSYLGQQAPRVKAVVAWDNLCVPVQPSPDELSAFLADPVNTTVGGALDLYGLPTDCFGAPNAAVPSISKPSLGLTSDYILPTGYAQPPDPQAKSAASRAYSAAGVDSGEIVIRGGTHVDFGDLPLPGAPISATLRGADMAAWYTVAWFEKYLQHNVAADKMLLTTRWDDDAAQAAIDPLGDSNLLSWHYASRMDIGLRGGGRFDCENLRAGCMGQLSAADDGGPADYTWVSAGRS